MAGRPYLLAETTWKTVRAQDYEVAILPWGATEAHNYHLPYATDTMQCDFVATEAAKLAWEQGARVIVLPTVPFGVQTGQLDIPFCINVNPTTQFAILGDIARCLDFQGIQKLVVLNGHGGNDFRQMIRELQPSLKLFLCAVNWYKVVDQTPFFSDLGDHAGEMETSAMMHIAANLVLPLSEAGAGRQKQPRLRAMREGWAWAPRPWSRISADTGVGDPYAATAEKGGAYLSAVAKKLSQFLAELAATDQASLYGDDSSS